MSKNKSKVYYSLQQETSVAQFLRVQLCLKLRIKPTMFTWT